MADDSGFVNISSVAAEFEFRGKWSRQRSYSLARQYGQRVVEVARQNASGRPGPNIITGDYVGSFFFEVTDFVGEGGVGAGVEAGSDAPQAMRLEYGFVGTDSLGRVYDQPPFPHWGPAVDVVAPEFEASMTAMVDFDVAADL